jgi:hypothetical protein
MPATSVLYVLTGESGMLELGAGHRPDDSRSFAPMQSRRPWPGGVDP